MKYLFFLLPAILFLPGCSPETTKPTATVSDLADAYTKAYFVRFHPEKGTSNNLPNADHASLYIPSEENIALEAEFEDSLYRELLSLDTLTLSDVEETMYYTLKERLEAKAQLRHCKTHLWSLSSLSGFQSRLEELSDDQPAATETDRHAVLHRWGSIPRLIETEITNNSKGLEQGYVLPKPLIEQYISLLENYLKIPVEEHYLFDPGRRSNDTTFQQALRGLIQDSIYPAFETLKSFLEKDYLPRSRATFALRELPEGRQCYLDLIRYYTSLQLSENDLIAIADTLEQQMRQKLIPYGEELYGESDPDVIREKYFNDSLNYINGQNAISIIIENYEATVKKRSEEFIDLFPVIPLQIKWIPEYREAMESYARYTEPRSINDTAITYVNRLLYDGGLRGDLASTLFHEGFPGHHLQYSFAIADSSRHTLNNKFFYPGFGEGWATYAEIAITELEWHKDPRVAIIPYIYSNPQMLGMNNTIELETYKDIDVYDFFEEKYQSDSAFVSGYLIYTTDLVAYNNAYGLGFYKILQLREKAKRILGDDFSLQEFHYECLKYGDIPLSLLERKINKWIAGKKEESSMPTAG